MDNPSPCDLRYLQVLLRRHGFHSSKRRGQNFLIDPLLPERIADAARLDDGVGVVEIGPGPGALTQALAARAGAVLAYEVDRRFAPILAETLAGHAHVTVLWEDALRADLRADAARHLAGKTPVVCANLPYAVTTPVLTALLECGLFSRMVLMVQKEVAQRLTAPPGVKAYGAFTLYVGARARTEILFDVPPQAFYPAPQVTSSVISLRAAPVPLRAPGMFRRVTRAAFAQRRKTLLNALAGVVSCDRDALVAHIKSCGLSPSARGETLGIAEYETLSFALSQISSSLA